MDDKVDEDHETVVLTATVSGLTVTGVTLTILDNDTASVRVWALPDASGLTANGDAAPSSRVDTEVGFGLPVFGGAFTGTPNVGFGLSDAAREVRMGWRLRPANGEGFEVNLDATRREPADGNDAEHGVMLSGRLHW